jgi:membrane-bound lytic murein transglycosylase B
MWRTVAWIAGALAASPACAEAPAPVTAPATVPRNVVLDREFDLTRPEIVDFMKMMVDKHAYDGDTLARVLSSAQSQQSIVDAMTRPAEKAKPWYDYRAQFITDKRVSDGIAFWSEHRAEVATAAEKYGVDPEFLVAILGIETFYGRREGKYRVVDALATLAFDYPPRAKFFTGELEEFFLLAREYGVDPLTAVGSYAGAMGAPQFMPSSYRRFGVDAVADGAVDLWSSWPDVFESVARYFKEFGWEPGAPVMSEAIIDPEKAKTIDGRKVALGETVASLRGRGFQFDTTLPLDASALPIAFDLVDGPHWRIGFKNFYVITRYNRSPMYAMAVTELAGLLKETMTHSAANTP